MKLVIAEKPSVAMSLAAVLGATERKDGYLEGSGYLVSWCVGHLLELAQPEAYKEQYAKWRYEDLPILPENWKYEVPKDKKTQLALLCRLMKDKRVDSVVCATDAGREGELIFRLVYEYAGCKKPMERLWISSMEDAAIREGFDHLHPGSDYDKLYDAAVCRAGADWLIGINATRLFSVLYGVTLNVGRVMSPTLALLVQRESDIESFISKPFYVPEITCGGFTASGEKMTERSEAEKIRMDCDHNSAFVRSVEKQVKTMNLKNRTSCLFKIVLFIIFSIFVAEIIVLPKIEHDMLKEAGRQELVTVQQLCGAVLEKNPDVEQDFILGLRQPTKSWQEKGEQILNQYGYDEEHLLADNTLYAAYMIAWRNWTGFFLITTFLLLATSLLYFYSMIRNSNREILLILEQYLSEDFSFAYGTERIAKGRIHFMSNQIGDRLKQLGHQIVTKNTRITEERESTKALVTDISHQLKTPMAALKTCFYIYLDASDADEKMEFLKRSETQLEKLEQLIASLMNISRLETAMISLTKEPILLSDLLVDAVNGVYEKARRKNIEISLQETENIALQLDKHWTTEAVINVLDNAVKYSPQNSHITISIEKQHFYTLVKITDEGIGISQSEYNKIFQRFYRSNHSYVKKTEGSGVGLYLTRMILERQGGLIRVESVPEKGSTFILQFRN